MATPKPSNSPRQTIATAMAAMSRNPPAVAPMGTTRPEPTAMTHAAAAKAPPIIAGLMPSSSRFKGRVTTRPFAHSRFDAPSLQPQRSKAWEHHSRGNAQRPLGVPAAAHFSFVADERLDGSSHHRAWRTLVAWLYGVIEISPPAGNHARRRALGGGHQEPQFALRGSVRERPRRQESGGGARRLKGRIRHSACARRRSAATGAALSSRQKFSFADGTIALPTRCRDAANGSPVPRPFARLAAPELEHAAGGVTSGGCVWPRVSADVSATPAGEQVEWLGTRLRQGAATAMSRLATRPRTMKDDSLKSPARRRTARAVRSIGRPVGRFLARDRRRRH